MWLSPEMSSCCMAPSSPVRRRWYAANEHCRKRVCLFRPVDLSFVEITWCPLFRDRHRLGGRRLDRRAARLVRHALGARIELALLDLGIGHRLAPGSAVLGLRPGLILQHVGVLVDLVAGGGLALGGRGAA